MPFSYLHGDYLLTYLLTFEEVSCSVRNKMNTRIDKIEWRERKEGKLQAIRVQ